MGTKSLLRYQNNSEPAPSAGSEQLSGRGGTATGQPTNGLSTNTLRMSRCSASDILGYVPPVLHTGQIWYIDYYAKHPGTGKLVRKRIKVNHVPAGTARRRYAQQVMAELTRKLQAGWSPWAADAAPRGFVTMGEALDQFDRTKERQLRHSSPYSYTSMISVFREWCRPLGLLERYANQFNRADAIAFLDHISEQRMVGNRTYNNYLVMFGMLMEWQKERGFRADNPFQGFKKRKQAQKSRTYLTEQERQEMVAWLRANDPGFLFACLFVYGTLIRPGELRRLRVHHVDLQRQVVHLPAEETKSGIERMPAIPDWMLAELLAYGLDKQPGKAWLISPDLLPGNKPIARNTLNRRWVAMRRALGWPTSKQLYSLRDTGIIQLLRDGVDLLHVRQQAGHTDVATTNSYLKHAFPQGPAEVMAKATPLHRAGGL